MYRRRVVYGDLKLQNILIDSRGNIKLTDFNLAVVENERI